MAIPALLLVLLLIAAGVVLMVVLTRATASPVPSRTAPTDDGQARRILDERLAWGDIDANEYREHRAALLE